MEKTFPKMLRLNDVMRATGLKKSSIYNKMKRNGKYFDADFPTSIALSNTGRGAVAWNEFAIQKWIETRSGCHQFEIITLHIEKIKEELKNAKQ